MIFIFSFFEIRAQFHTFSRPRECVVRDLMLNIGMRSRTAPLSNMGPGGKTATIPPQTLDEITFKADDNQKPDSVLELGSLTTECLNFEYRKSAIAISAFFFVLLKDQPYKISEASDHDSLRNMLMEFLSKRSKCMAMILEAPGKSLFLKGVVENLQETKDRLDRDFEKEIGNIENEFDTVLGEFETFVQEKDKELYERSLKDKAIMEVLSGLPSIGLYFQKAQLERNLDKAIRIIESDESYPKPDHEGKMSLWGRIRKLFGVSPANRLPGS